jgi:hypothetical protein
MKYNVNGLVYGCLLACAALPLSTVILADSTLSKTHFSPYAERDYPSALLWGDTHLHTNLSLDARAFGATLSPDDAYRFAKGEEVTSSNGEQIQLARALDFLVVADHSDAIGAMDELIKGNPKLLKDPTAKDWYERLSQGGETALMATMDIIAAFTGRKTPAALTEKGFVTDVWGGYLDTADQHNDPGYFTAMIGYEWTSTTGGDNLHRNVLYRDDASVAKQVLPYTVAESDNPEDLWRWLEAYENQTGGEILALAHNGNLSNGLMFPMLNPATGGRIDKDYALMRSRWEPLYEVTQIKGDGEAHPYLSTTDEFADYETWDRSNLGPVLKEPEMLQYEYAREALKNGLKLESSLGVNPYKFGMIGSTDSHTGLATADEDNFFGKHSGVEPGADRWKHKVGEFGSVKVFGWEMASSGYAAVWASENSRESIFDAMKRKEVYATTGSRISVRFFGGWDYESEDALARPMAAVGYDKGVPMGGDLTQAPENKSPSFLVSAHKDEMSGNLDRVQIIKGWLDAKGETHEKVYDVVWSGTRKIDSTGNLPSVGSTVDVENATWRNSIGASELKTVWRDPDFNAEQNSFYYARVLEIPTPRWTAYDARRYGSQMDKNIAMQTVERAYTSPIWYTP